jgi:hypothetical protein
VCVSKKQAASTSFSPNNKLFQQSFHTTHIELHGNTMSHPSYESAAGMLRINTNIDPGKPGTRLNNLPSLGTIYCLNVEQN